MTGKGRRASALKSIDGALARFAVLPLIGDFREPLPCLAIHIVQIGELPQGPETLARIPDGALHFSFFPTRRHIAGLRIKAILAGESEKAREETDQAAVVFGDGSGQIVIGDFTRDAAQRRERMHVTADEGFKALAMGELQIQHAAVRFHQGESVELAFVARHSPVRRSAPNRLRSARRAAAPSAERRGWVSIADERRVHTSRRIAVPALVAQRPQPLFHDGRRSGGVLFQPFGDGGFEGIELAFALPLRGPLCRRIQIFFDGAPAHAQMPFDLADRPALGPVQAVQVVDLIGREHGATLCYPAEAAWIPGRCCLQDSEAGGFARRKCFQNPDLRRKLSCCLQDSGGRRPAARSLRRNALGRKLSCCLQDRADAVFDPERAAVGGCARRRLGVARDTAASNRGFGTAISAGCPGIPGGIPDPRRSFWR